MRDSRSSKRSGKDCKKVAKRKGCKLVNTNPTPLAQCPLLSTVGHWFIDAEDGNDRNTGTSENMALKTHAELECRLRGRTVLPPLVGPVRPWTVTLLTDLPTTDPVGLNDVTFGPDVIPQYIGAATVQLRAGTISVIAAARNRFTNTPWTITFSGPLNASDLFQRIRNPVTGAISYLIEDSSIAFGANTFVTMDWAIPTPFPVPGITSITPAPTNPYVVEQLTKMMFKCDWEVYFAGNSNIPVQSIGFTDLEIINMANSSTTILDVNMEFVGCRISPQILVAGNSSWTLKNSLMLNGIILDNPGGLNKILSGGAVAAGNGGLNFGVNRNVVNGSGILQLDYDTMCYGGPAWHNAPGTTTFVGFAATFKAPFIPAADGTGFEGIGFDVHSGANATNFNIGAGGSHLWGNGNALYGLEVHGLGAFYYAYTCSSFPPPVPAGCTPAFIASGMQVPTITGPVIAGVQRDWTIGFDGGGFGGPPATTFTAGVFNPPTYLTFVPGTAQDKTWLNLVAVQPAGYGGNATEVYSGGRILNFPFNNL